MTLDPRKAAILRAVVERYIETAQPVGSSVLANTSEIDASPATVRSELAALERDGYLVQPHTSAGRIPTDQGYRFFVDELVATPKGDLAPSQQRRVRDFFDKTHGEIEDMLQSTSNLLSQMTSYAAVVVEPPSDIATIRSIQLVPISTTHCLLIVVLSNGTVEKHSIESSDQISDLDAATVSAHLSQSLIGKNRREVPEVSAISDDVRDRLLSACALSLTADASIDSERAFVDGTAQMVSSFPAVETVRDVLATLEKQYIVVSLLREVLGSGLSVAIGAEHGVQPLADCSIVVAPFNIEGEAAGTVGVLGPTRMDYSRAIATVSVVSENLSRRLSEG